MPRDDATDERKVQVVGKNRELRLLTSWAWAMRFSGSVNIATRKQAVTVRMDRHIRGRIIFPKLLVRAGCAVLCVSEEEVPWCAHDDASIDVAGISQWPLSQSMNGQFEYFRGNPDRLSRDKAQELGLFLKVRESMLLGFRWTLNR